MFGSKTTRMLACLDRYKYQKRSFIAFKPAVDDRYSESSIVTHSGFSVPAMCVDNVDDLKKAVWDRRASDNPVDVIAVDEAFMIEGISEALIDLFREGYTILVASIQMSSDGKPFHEIKEMLPWATKIEICPAVCAESGMDAYYTYSKVEKRDEITVGGEDIYEPRSWSFHDKIRLKGER